MAGVATPVVHGVLVAMTILLYTMFATEETIATLSSVMGVWGIPVLTLLGAAWAARRAEHRSAVLNGLLVGLLVAIGPLFGLLGPPSPLVAVLTVATGFLGGWLAEPAAAISGQARHSCGPRMSGSGTLRPSSAALRSGDSNV